MPRKKAIKKEEEDEFDADLAMEQVPEDELETPKKTPKKRTPRKKKQPTPGSDDDEEAKPKKRKSSTKKPQYEEGVPFTDEFGFTNIFPSIIYRVFGDVKGNSKIAGVDLDGTVIVEMRRTKEQLNKGKQDWDWWNKEVVEKLRDYHDEGYRLVVFTNQNGIKGALEGAMASKIKNRINQAVEKLDRPITVIMAPAKDHARKPDIGMWTFLCEQLSMGVVPDPAQSFYIGDAAGREDDFAASDKEFAENAGLKFMTPEEVFGEPAHKKAFNVLSPSKRAEEAAQRAEGNALGKSTGPAAVSENQGLLDCFEQLVQRYETAKENPFKLNATKKVAGIVREYPKHIDSPKVLANVKGVGKGSIEKIKQYLENGTFAELGSLEGVAVEKATAAPQVAHAFL